MSKNIKSIRGCKFKNLHSKFLFMKNKMKNYIYIYSYILFNMIYFINQKK